jgi:hypothetical protein
MSRKSAANASRSGSRHILAIVHAGDAFVQALAAQEALALQVDHALRGGLPPSGGKGRLVRWATNITLSRLTAALSNAGCDSPRRR